VRPKRKSDPRLALNLNKTNEEISRIMFEPLEEEKGGPQ